ncbi:hypothetical protein LMG27952_04491 [Paraburkholderia hiiakae]|uniref:Rhs element Vgr protein n=1 Tax=Paraburkholderia hiiakae TaxID=1081782 RepID=A0ABM8NWJ8_9BURK|nr:hypothetical protein LMG27952_04491 [Paraburkholderia hiiakae]
MAYLQEALPDIPGRQEYYLSVPGVDSAAQLSVVSFEATEAMSQPTEVRITLTHPQRLPRTDYLNLDAVFSIVADDGTVRKFSGYIERFSVTQGTNDEVRHEIVLKSHVGRLAAVTRTKIYQHASTPDILAAGLREHGMREHQFSFRLRRAYPKHAFRMQYGMADSAYAHMMQEKSGVFFFIQETEYGDQVVYGDDVDHYLYEPRLIVPYREAAGLEAGGVEAVASIKTHAVTVRQSFIVADYSPQKAWERFRDSANVAPQDPTTYGTPYVYGTHHLDQAGAKWEAQLRHEAAIAWQIVYEGESNVLALQPGRVFETDIVLPDAPKGQLIVEITHSGARDKPYTNRYRAIPADRRFRLKLEPQTWAKVTGTLSARVTSPDSYTYSYITAEGHYTVRFDADFERWSNGGESVPLRLAKPFAGKLQTGMHFPALDDAEAVIQCRDGDPDKPEITAFHHHSQARDLITNDRRWLSRNVIRTQKNNKLRMEDWAGQEGIKLSTEHSGKSQLNLGYLVNNKLDYRGEGFELRTSGYGVSRAGNGLHLTTYDRPDATGQLLDMHEAIAQLESALATAKALAASASSAKAEPADTDAQQQVKDDLDGLKQPGLLMSTPASAALVAGQGIQFAAEDSINAVAGKSTDWTVLKRWTVAAGERISLFAQKFGIKIFAAKGPVEFQAQGGPMAFISDKDMAIASTTGKVMVSAAKEIILECGGAFIQFKDGSITLGGPGDLFLKTITVQKKGKAQMHLAAPAFSSTIVPFTFSCNAWRRPVGADNTAPPPPAPETSDCDHLGNQATGNPEAPDPVAAPASSSKRSSTPQPPQQGATGSTNTPDASSSADQDSAHEPKKPRADDASVPIKLAPPVVCDWHTPAFTMECTDTTETGQYHGVDDHKNAWPDAQSLSGAQFDTAFELSYDQEKKTLYATVRVQVIPVDLFKCDESGVLIPGTDGQPQSIPYHHDIHAFAVAFGTDRPVNGYVMKYRNSTGPNFDAFAKSSQIESVLNEHKSKLILNGCSRDTACGCRVSVVFKVDLSISVNAAETPNTKKAHKTIHLFPKTQRADGGSWGEGNMYPEAEPDKSAIWKDMPYDTNVLAHECGHLFNYPDEYSEFGGWVHEQYIKDKKLNFILGDANATKETWQISSAKNVMGGGCNKRISSAKNSPSATVHPYYLEYIRRHFCELTGEHQSQASGDKKRWKKWRIGYDG